MFQKEKQPLAPHKEGGDEPWAQEPQLGKSPREVLAPFPSSSCSFQKTGKSLEQNQAEKWEFPLLFCPDTVCGCRVTPGLHPHPREICLRSGSRCCISLISNHLLIALRIKVISK